MERRHDVGLVEDLGSNRSLQTGEIPPEINPAMLRSPGFCAYLRLFVRLRWLAIIATVAVILFFQIFIKSKFEYFFLYAISGCILLYNVGFWIYTRRNCLLDDVEDGVLYRRSRINALLQINFDLVALFSLLHFSSGLENPCVLFFVFHVVIAAALLKPRWALLEAAFASSLIFALGLLEHYSILDHYHAFEILGRVELTDSWLFVLGLPAMITTTIFFLSFFTILLMRERNRRREIIVALMENLSHSNKQLMRVDEGRRALLAVASHDLKSPIAAVASYLATLKGGYIGEVSEQQVAVLDKCLHRLDGLKEFVNDVLSWTAIQSGELTMSMRKARLEPIVDKVLSHYRDRANERSITIESDLKDLPEVTIAPERISQVFENLVSNAIKYSHEGGVVSLDAALNDEHIILSVKDEGIGMSDEDQAHLFEGFFRASSVKTKIEGTGLGLSLVKGIVKAHGGKIWAESKLGKGSTFFVQLPF